MYADFCGEWAAEGVAALGSARESLERPAGEPGRENGRARCPDVNDLEREIGTAWV